MAEVLNLLGHTAHVALRGEAALDLAAQLNPEVVLLDIGLPDLDGYEVARRLRIAHGSGLRLVALTGYGGAAEKAKAREAGFDLHLVKPPAMSEIEAAIAGPVSPV